MLPYIPYMDPMGLEVSNPWGYPSHPWGYPESYPPSKVSREIVGSSGQGAAPSDVYVGEHNHRKNIDISVINGLESHEL